MAVRKDFSLSFRGYDPAGVRALLEKMDQEYRASLMQLRKQLADEVHSLELLKVEINKLKTEISRYKSMEEKVADELLKAHLAAAEKASNTLKEVARAEKEAAQRVMHKRSELASLKATMGKVKREINSIVSEYLSVKDKAEGE